MAYCLAYVATLGPQSGAAEIPACIRAMRSGSRTFSVNGVLLFDGLNFLHVLEGGESGVASLLERFKTLVHGDTVRLLQDGALLGERIFESWDVGYCSEGELDSISHSARQDVAAFLRRIKDSLISFDMPPWKDGR